VTAQGAEKGRHRQKAGRRAGPVKRQQAFHGAAGNCNNQSPDNCGNIGLAWPGPHRPAEFPSPTRRRGIAQRPQSVMRGKRLAGHPAMVPAQPLPRRQASNLRYNS